MIRIVIRGAAAVFRDDVQTTDHDILESLDGLVYDGERFTDYFSEFGDEGELAAALEPGGFIRFGYSKGDELLTATTEYKSRRLLTEAELRLLVEYTLGQWSDGIGENWACISPETCGYGIMCLTLGDGVAPDYPVVQVISDV